jgi:predicted lactoylglutathione lyase
MSSIYVNLPVNDLAVAARFYEAIGCKKNEQFSDDKAASMVWSDTITFHLLTREYFATFAPREVADAHGTCQVLLALTRDRREDVDAITQAAATNGGKADIREPMDMGWLYNRAFEDADGHVFEAVWMDMDAAANMPSESSST